jgi:hypothetical protein
MLKDRFDNFGSYFQLFLVLTLGSTIDTAINVWHSILEEAQKRDKVEVVLEVAVQEYGDSLDLQRAELLWFANQVELTGDELTDFFHASLPKNLSKSLTANSIDQALQHLWNVVPRTTDGRLPRLEFAERLARHTPNAELAQQLRGWISRGSKHIDPMLQLENVQIMVTKVEQSIEKAAATPAYLMVVLQPHDDNRNRPENHQEFFLYIVFWKAEGKSYLEQLWYPQRALTGNEELSQPDKPLVKLAELHQVFHEVLLRHADIMSRESENVTIEVFLPAEHIGCALDQWPDLRTRRRPSKMTYGARYPCTVRAFERLYEPALSEWWWRKWHRYADQHELTNHMLWATGRLADPDELEIELERQPHIVCVAIPYLPAGAATESAMYDVCLDAGIPIAIWPRQSKGLINEDELKEQIKCSMLAALPGHIRALRLEAISCETHLAKHLTLLWDDPRRIPSVTTKPLVLPTK